MSPGAVREVYSRHFFEHVDDVQRLLLAISRVLRPGGIMRVVVPHFSNPWFYSDPTHRTHFGLYTFAYFARCSIFKRPVPGYVRNVDYELTKVQLLFRSPPFRTRNA